MLVACAAPQALTGTPTLYLKKEYPADAIPETLQTTDPKLFFITDRFLSDTWTDEAPYSSDRSPSMAFGEVIVSFGSKISWPKLVEYSTTKDRGKQIKLQITDADELIRFPSTPLLFTQDDDQVEAFKNPPYRVYKRREMELKNKLSSLLKQANRKEVVLYVHGINNEFSDAAYTMADLWHFSGRIGVPIFFTWPSGSGGPLGYLKDRESGEYSIYHLKETLRLISETPGLEKLHIIAHSRGTDVVTTAMRELIIEQRGRNLLANRKYKIENLILAAPDLDFGVMRQRLIAENFGQAFGNINIYVNRKDGALKFAQRITSGQRTGQLSVTDLENIDREIYARVGNLHFIDVENADRSSNHSYFRQNPNVLSDIALTLQTGTAPGGTNRPLLPISGNFWKLSKFYPFDLPPKGFETGKQSLRDRK